MKMLSEIDFYNWTIGFAICKSKKTDHICIMITLLCFALMIMPYDKKS